MLVFVDESGDPGMKLGHGSSDCFAVVAVIFEDRGVALACNEAINQLRGQVGFAPQREFKFNKCSRQIREAFLQTTAQFPFVYHAVVLNKANLIGPGFKYKNSLYKYPIKLVFENARSILKEATVYFDACGSREFTREVGVYVRKHMMGNDGTAGVRKIKAARSHGNNLIQLADMVCGAVARSFKIDKPDYLGYREIVKKREVRVQFWPK